jgi:hypothetical protein
MSKKAAELAEQMAQMLEVIGTLEARLTELKKMARKGARKGGGAKAVAAAKPKRPPTAWIQFTQRVRAALVTASQPFPRVADLMKFCKDLRIQKGEGCTDEEILALRDGWEAPTPVQSVGGDAAEAADAVAAPTCPTCSEEIGAEPEKHRACVRAVAAAAQAAGADPMKAVDAWSEAVQSGPRSVPVRAPVREQVAASRARTPLRRPSAPIHFNSAAGAAPAATLNTPSEEMVVEEV